MKMNRLDEVQKEIYRVFPKSPPPDAESITSHDDCCEDGATLKKDFSGKEWWRVNQESIIKNHGNLPLFSTVAYPYYFPAFLIHSLTDLTDGKLITEFILYSLSKPDTEEDTNYVDKRFRLFTLEQVEFLAHFLEWLVRNTNEKESRYLHSDAKRVLESWTKRLKYAQKNLG